MFGSGADATRPARVEEQSDDRGERIEESFETVV